MRMQASYSAGALLRTPNCQYCPAWPLMHHVVAVRARAHTHTATPAPLAPPPCLSCAEPESRLSIQDVLCHPWCCNGIDCAAMLGCNAGLVACSLANPLPQEVSDQQLPPPGSATHALWCTCLLEGNFLFHLLLRISIIYNISQEFLSLHPPRCPWAAGAGDPQHCYGGQLGPVQPSHATGPPLPDVWPHERTCAGGVPPAACGGSLAVAVACVLGYPCCHD